MKNYIKSKIDIPAIIEKLTKNLHYKVITVNDYIKIWKTKKQKS